MVRHTTVLFLLLAAGLSLVLFSVKYQVQDLEQELNEINQDILKHRQVIHVLKAEWSHLNDPRRLRQQIKRHLEMSPVRPEQVGTLEQIPARPAHPEETGGIDPAAHDGQPVSATLANRKVSQ